MRVWVWKKKGGAGSNSLVEGPLYAIISQCMLAWDMVVEMMDWELIVRNTLTYRNPETDN